MDQEALENAQIHYKLSCNSNSNSNSNRPSGVGYHRKHSSPRSIREKPKLPALRDSKRRDTQYEAISTQPKIVHKVIRRRGPFGAVCLVCDEVATI